MKDTTDTSQHVDVLIFVEDPGAANYVAHLPYELSKNGLKAILVADGYARSFLAERGCEVHTVVDADEMLTCFKPRLLMVGTSENVDTLGLKLVIDARKAGIASVGVVDSYPNALHRFRGREESPLAYAPDWLIVPDRWTKREYTSVGYPEDRTIICGHPHYDYVLAVANDLKKEDRNILRKRCFPGITGDQRVVVFVAEVSTGLDCQQYLFSEEYTLRGRGTSLGRTQIALEEFLDAGKSIDSKLYMVLRLHPKNVRTEFHEYIDEFAFVSSGGSPLELIYASDLVVGMTTTLLFEAVLLGRPTLSIVPRKKEADWLPSIRMGLTPCVNTRETLMSELRSLLTRESSEADSIAKQEIVLGSTDLIVNSVNRIINS